MPREVLRTGIRGAIALAILVGGWSDPSYAESETALPIPRASSLTEQKLHEEALYLKEETVSIASRYEQPISKAPSDVYVITDEDIRSSGATDIPTLLRQVPGMEVMQTNAADFNVSVREITSWQPISFCFSLMAAPSMLTNQASSSGSSCRSPSGCRTRGERRKVLF